MRTYRRNTSHARSEERSQLLAAHVDMARRIALRIARRTPDWMDPDDLVSAAMLGLAEAADRYDLSRAEPFAGFAEKRIRGAVLDELRRGDPLPRRVRSTARRVARAIRELEQKLGRSPEDEEVAAALDVSVETYRKELEGLTHVALIELPSGDRDDTLAPAAGACGDDTSPAAEAERRQMVAKVRAAFDHLEPRDATLLSLYYVEELTYGEIGKVLGVSESRVCQLHSRALLRLRAVLEPELGDLGEAA